MKVGVCGVACEKCPRMVRGTCPSGEAGCKPKENPFCKVSTCAYHRGVELRFVGPPDAYVPEAEKTRLLLHSLWECGTLRRFVPFDVVRRPPVPAE